LKSENDHLRFEINEWRDRAGLMRIKEPVRREGFSMVKREMRMRMRMMARKVKARMG